MRTPSTLIESGHRALALLTAAFGHRDDPEIVRLTMRQLVRPEPDAVEDLVALVNGMVFIAARLIVEKSERDGVGPEAVLQTIALEVEGT